MASTTTTTSHALLRHAGFVSALARAALRGDSESEDLAQDAWVAALEHAPEGEERQRSWFVRVVRNRATDLLRRRARRLAREQSGGRPEARPGPAELAERAEMGRRAVAAVLALEEPFRSAVLLRFQEGLAPAVLAARLDVPLDTARSRVRRGLERVRATLLTTDSHAERRGARTALVALAGGPAWFAAAATGGTLMTKKTLLAAGVLLLSGGAWLALELATRRPVLPVPPGTGVASEAPVAAGPPTLEGQRPAGHGTPPAGVPTPTAPLPSLVGSVRGIVVDDQGAPVAGAQVSVAIPPSGLWSQLDRPRAAETDAPALDPVVSGADGRFELTPRGGGVLGGVSLVARAPGRVQVSPGGRNAPVHVPHASEARLVLVEGVRLAVRVLEGGSGTPVADAWVKAFGDGGYQLFGQTPIDEARTDGEGRATLTLLGQNLRLVAGAPGRGQAATARTSVLDLPAEVRLTLGHAGDFVGRILRPDGTPAAGARLLLLKYPLQRAEATADAEGRFRFTDVPLEHGERPECDGQRDVLLRIEASGLPVQWVPVAPLPATGFPAADLTLGPARTLEVRVRYPDGNPAVDVPWEAAVVTGRPGWGWTSYTRPGAEGTTDSAGMFRVSSLPAGPVWLWFRGDEGEPAARAEVPSGSDPPLLDVRLERRPDPLLVRVRDADERPVRAAHVRAFGRSFSEAAEGDTGADGNVRLDPPGAGPWSVSVDPGEGSPVCLDAVTREQAEGGLTVRLGRGVIAGRLLRLDGTPAPSRIALTATLRLPQHAFAQRGTRGARLPDADGRFRFEGVSDGLYALESLDAGFRVLEGGYTRRADQTGLVVHLVAPGEVDALTLTASVVDAEDGQALVGAAVWAEPLGGGEPLGLYPEGPSGPYRAHQLAAPGTWVVRAEAKGHERAEARVEVSPRAPRPSIRLTLARVR